MTDTLVIGGTGAMGSRVVLRLLETTDSDVTVFTRNAMSEQSLDLVRVGQGRVRLVIGDVDDADSLRAAMANVTRVFSNTNFLATRSALGEYRQGLALLDAAEHAGIERFIWSSLDSALTLTGGRIAVPHFDSKASVAAFINLQRAEEMMQKVTDGWYSDHVSVLTTSPYFENLQLRLAPRPGTLPDGRDGLVFSLPLGETGEYPLVGLDDIAWFAGYMFDNWQSWGGRDLAVSGDSLTGAQLAESFERVTGIPAGYVPVPLEFVRSSIPHIGHDFAAMFEFFQSFDVVGQARDMSVLRRLHPELASFEGWLSATGWTGDETKVQKQAVRMPVP